MATHSIRVAQPIRQETVAGAYKRVGVSFVTINVQTNFDYPPIPVRDMDWSAIDSDTYDVDCDQDGFFSKSPVGHGKTEQEAIADLIDQMDVEMALQ